jgi:ubiquitin C-terminal hydrolase
LSLENNSSSSTSFSNTFQPKSKFAARTQLFDSPKKGKATIYTKKVGLENLGNTCYLNTSLQCLIHCKKFTSLFMKSLEKDSDALPISVEFFKMLKEILQLKDNDVYKPKIFLAVFSEEHKKFKGFVQHDAQEFLRHFLEDISNEMNRVKEIPGYKELQLKNKSKINSNKAFHDLFLERENSIIVDLFYGQICNIFACESCNFKTYSFEKIMDIPILLGISFLI